MKLLSTLLLAFFLFTNAEAQLITKKQISTKGSYGEKKLKKHLREYIFKSLLFSLKYQKKEKPLAKEVRLGGIHFHLPIQKWRLP